MERSVTQHNYLVAGLSLLRATPRERWVSIVAGIVMVINVLLAATLGMLPMGLKRLELDSALISGLLMTTTLDAIGFLTFLSMISTALNVFHFQA